MMHLRDLGTVRHWKVIGVKGRFADGNAGGTDISRPEAAGVIFLILRDLKEPRTGRWSRRPTREARVAEVKRAPIEEKRTALAVEQCPELLQDTFALNQYSPPSIDRVGIVGRVFMIEVERYRIRFWNSSGRVLIVTSMPIARSVSMNSAKKSATERDVNCIVLTEPSLA
jgi:hypothetical protein